MFQERYEMHRQTLPAAARIGKSWRELSTKLLQSLVCPQSKIPFIENAVYIES
jgi:hypothetical protein